MCQHLVFLIFNTLSDAKVVKNNKEFKLYKTKNDKKT